jgi:hypothetical protein
MFQCPGCLDFVNIKILNQNKPPIAFDIESNLIHECNKLKELQKWVADIAAAEFEEFLLEMDDPEYVYIDVDRSTEES